MAQFLPQPQGGTQEPITVQIDPEWCADFVWSRAGHRRLEPYASLHSVLKELLKEFLNPPRTSDPGADFFAVYRKESNDFDRDYAARCDEDFNTTLVFAGLLSVVSTTFVASVQPKLEPDPNNATAIYVQVLIHTMNNTLFPDVDPNSATWTSPPREAVIAQSLLYASLATSLFAALLAVLGKQWVVRYLRNRRGSTADQSRDRQRKLNGLEEWYFYIVPESLLMILQFALLLLASALPVYLWTICRVIAGVILGFALSVGIAYTFFTLIATPN